jgi:hypothetical protein
LYDDFVRDDEAHLKVRKPFGNGKQDNATSQGQAPQGNKKPKSKPNKSKVADTPAARLEKVEKAIGDLQVADIQSVLKICMSGEPNNPLVWLTAVAHMFNMKIVGNVKDLVNSTKSFGTPSLPLHS